MNFFVNDGSFLDRFKQTSTSQSSGEEESKIKFRLNQKPSNSKSLPTVSSSTSVISQKFHTNNSFSSSLSAQLIEKTSKLSSQVRCTKILHKKPKVFDDSVDADYPDLDPKTKEVVENLARSVGLIGIQAELMAKERNSSNPAYWFLNDKSSEAYKYYSKLVEDHKKLNEAKFSAVVDDKKVQNADVKVQPESSRKRRSRWDDSKIDAPSTSFVVITPPTPTPSVFQPVVTAVQPFSPISSSETNNFNPKLFPSVVGQSCFAADFVPVASSSTTNYFDDDSNFKQESDDDSQILFQKQILASQLAAKALARAAREKEGKPMHEYDSDEDVDGGTWEHKKRTQEMERTKDQAQQLTKLASGKHHIGDFLPLEERGKFYEALKKSKEKTSPTTPVDKSEYQDNKLLEDNVGFKLLQKMGWSAGKGLGANEQGIVAPVNKGRAPNDLQGLGSASSSSTTEDDDLFDVYRKRMMLAYRYRPNPLNNPRRPYY